MNTPNAPIALLVIDITKSALLPAHSAGIPVVGAEEAIRNAIRMVGAARDARAPVIFIHERHRRQMVDFGRELDGAEGVHFLEGDPNTEFLDDLKPQECDYYVPKRRYSAFFGTDLEILLKGLGTRTVMLVGLLTDVCIHYTAVDAHQHDYHIRVVEEAVAGSTLPAHEAALVAIEYLQAGAVVSYDEALAQLSAHQLAEAATV